jgi:hypothetical protein
LRSSHRAATLISVQQPGSGGLVTLLPKLPPRLLFSYGVSRLQRLNTAAQWAKASERVDLCAAGDVWKDNTNQFRGSVKQLRETASLTRVNHPPGSFKQVLVGDENGMLAARWHQKPNLLTLPDCLQLCRLVEDGASEDIGFATSDFDPYCFRPPIGDPRPSVVHNDLQIVWMLRVKASSQLWVSAPFHNALPPNDSFCSAAVAKNSQNCNGVMLRWQS